MPPTPVPKNASDTASAGTCRAPPVSAAISFKPTAVIHGPPNDRPSSISDTLATTHEVRVSIECGAAAPRIKGRGLAARVEDFCRHTRSRRNGMKGSGKKAKAAA